MTLQLTRVPRPRRGLHGPVGVVVAFVLATGGAAVVALGVDTPADTGPERAVPSADQPSAAPGAVPEVVATGAPAAAAGGVSAPGASVGDAGAATGAAPTTGAVPGAGTDGQGVADQAAAAERAALAAAEAAARDEAQRQAEQDASSDPRFDGCQEANAQGYGHYVSGVDPEYDWYADADGDGVVCET